MKIIINSHIKYEKARQVLFDSLSKTGYINYNDIVVVLSGSTCDKEPYVSNNNYTIIESKLNNFDYNGYNMLYIYKDHNLIKDDFYLYLHDTTTFDLNFNKNLVNINNILINVPLDTVFIPLDFHSNICLFGNEVINQYKNNFELSLNKEEAIYLELHKSYTKNNKTINSISTYGSKYTISNRVEIQYPKSSPGGIDIYNNGHPRKGFFYPFFCIYKWVLWGKNGDFTENNVKQNKCWWVNDNI